MRDRLVLPLPAAQTIHGALAAVGVYQELVGEPGWTIDQYEHWVFTSSPPSCWEHSHDVLPNGGGIPS